MINLKDNEIGYGGKFHPIIQWAVWFMTPMGLFQDRNEAVERVKKSDLDPATMVIPVPVAIGPDQLYEVYARI